jgi:hypothetical protein
MPLKFDAAWRFEAPPGKIPRAAVEEFSALISKITAQHDLRETLEHFKDFFAAAAGTTSFWSTDVGWAETDLRRYMSQAADNPPLFIEAFYEGCAALAAKDVAVPSVGVMNKVLAKHGLGYRIEPPQLIATDVDAGDVQVDHAQASLDIQALEVLQQSISTSDEFLAQGKGRAAVQELLWLLETISTAFRGVQTAAGTVQGKYFNKIVEDLKVKRRGTTLNQVLDWIVRLHGYVSSPTGGGLRHGVDVKKMPILEQHEARLFCNLVKSYVNFLIDEHARLVGRKVLD